MQTEITSLLNQSLSDDKLDTNEKHELYQLLLTLDVDEKRYLRNQAFDLAREKIQQGNESLAILKWLERIAKLVDKSYGTDTVKSTAYFSPGDACRGAIIRLLDSARQRVDICVFTISDNRITEKVQAAHKRGVRVRIISDNDKAFDRGSDVNYLQEQGLPVCVDTSPKHMHHKFALIDQQLINGSFNWTRSATDYNQENIVVTNHALLLKQFEETFELLWQRFTT